MGIIKGEIIRNNHTLEGERGKTIKNNFTIQGDSSDSIQYQSLKILVDNELGAYLGLSTSEDISILSLYSKTGNLLSSVNLAKVEVTKLTEVYVDYVHKEIIFEMSDGTELFCDISYLLNSLDALRVDLSNEITRATAKEGELETAISTKAEDNEVVHLSGDETINGVKTFTSTPTINGDTIVKISDLSAYALEEDVVLKTMVDTSITSTASNSRVPSTKAVKDYVDSTLFIQTDVDW